MFFCAVVSRCCMDANFFVPRGKDVSMGREWKCREGHSVREKNGKVVQKIIPSKTIWQCGKESFFPADCGAQW